MHASDAVPSPAARLFAWTGAAIFLLALAYFLFAYAVTFGETWLDRVSARAIAVDVLLFSAFALHHSVFARGPVRTWIARVVPPYLERSVYVWIASLLFILVCAAWQPVGGALWRIAGPAAWGLHLAQGAGVVLTIRSAAVIDAFELAGIRQLDPRAAQEADFRTTGPYGWVRHPIYSGWFLMVWPVGTMTMTRFVFAAVSCVYLLIAIPLEEGSLRRTSGGAYERYASLVRWRLVPFVY